MTHESGEVVAAAEAWACEIWTKWREPGSALWRTYEVWTSAGLCKEEEHRPEESRVHNLSELVFVFYFSVVVDAGFHNIAAYKFDWI